VSAIKKAKAADAAIGGLIKAERARAGVSQETLGRAIGVSFQQVQKQERGANRMTVVAFARAARALGLTPSQMLAKIEDKL
jgi:transcriptional regulator with XRE-family HTH domain